MYSKFLEDEPVPPGTKLPLFISKAIFMEDNVGDVHLTLFQHFFFLRSAADMPHDSQWTQQQLAIRSRNPDSVASSRSEHNLFHSFHGAHQINRMMTIKGIG